MFVRRFIPLVAIVTSLAAPLSAGAQTAPPSPMPMSSAAPAMSGHHYHRAHGRRAFYRALRTLALTADQKRQIAGFRAAEKAADVNADPATKRANAEKTEGQIRAILTPDQQTQLSAALAQHGAVAPGAMSGPAAASATPAPASTP